MSGEGVKCVVSFGYMMYLGKAKQDNGEQYSGKPKNNRTTQQALRVGDGPICADLE